MRMLGGKSGSEMQKDEHEDVLATRAFADDVFDEDNGAYHSVMVQGVLGLSERPVKSADDSRARSWNGLIWKKMKRPLSISC